MSGDVNPWIAGERLTPRGRLDRGSGRACLPRGNNCRYICVGSNHIIVKLHISNMLVGDSHDETKPETVNGRSRAAVDASESFASAGDILVVSGQIAESF